MPDNSQSPSWGFYERTFAASRMKPYLDEYEGDKSHAIRLYEWNMEISAAFWELLGYLEIALRNRINERMSRTPRTDGGHWIFDFEQQSEKRQGIMIKEIANARNRIHRNGKLLTPDKLISELPFGFWVTLLSKRNRHLWPDLAAGFPGMPSRNQNNLFEKVASMRELRNRIGHHHRIWTLELAEKHRELLEIGRYLDLDLAAWLLSKSRVSELLRNQPHLER